MNPAPVSFRPTTVADLGAVCRLLMELKLPAAGAKDIYLLTTTAEGYFPRLGFVAVPRDTIPESVQASIEFRGACPDTATAMHLALQDA